MTARTPNNVKRKDGIRDTARKHHFQSATNFDSRLITALNKQVT